MLLGLLSFLSYWLGIYILTKVQARMSSMQVYVPDEKGIEFEKRISPDKANHLRSLYEKVFRSLDIRMVMGIMTDLLINETNLRIKAYNRLGITRQIVFEPEPEKNRSEALVVVNSGKFTVTNEEASGSYREQFIDSTTGLVLWERAWPKGGYNMRLIRNPEAGKLKERFCEGCGSPVLMEGEAYLCKNCGAKYTSDSYEWMLSHVAVWNAGVVRGAENDDSTLYSLIVKRIFPFGSMAMSVLGFFSGLNIILKFLTILSIAVNLLMYWIVGIPSIFWATTPYKKLIAFDSMASPMKVMDRAAYLSGMMYGCSQNEPAKIKPFMEPDCYRKWSQRLREQALVQQNSSQIFHWESRFSTAGIRKFWVSGGMQHVLVGGMMEYWYLTSDRKVHTASQYNSLILCRKEKVRYKRAMDVECFCCKNCEMPIDFTADGQCRFCGSGYDIADFDWKIEALNEHGEKTNQVYKKLCGSFSFYRKYRERLIDKHKQELRDGKALPPQIFDWDFEFYKSAREELSKEQAVLNQNSNGS